MRVAYSIAACFLTAVLAGCETSSGVSAGAPVSTTPYSLSSADSNAVKEGVRSTLKDPTSPIFGSMNARSSSDGTVSVCGYVNAKNSFGGYVGNTPYMGVLGANGTKDAVFVVTAMGGTDIETRVVYMMCSKYGIAI